MAEPSPVPSDHFTEEDFLADVAPEDLVYFLVNVGDGDAQLLVLPAERDGRRRAIVVDVGLRRKLPALVESLLQAQLLAGREDLFPLVVGTHPHEDHIAGMPEFLDRYGAFVREYWEPGYYHPSPSYMETMRALEEHPGIQHSQPTSGLTRFVGPVRVIVLAPTISLRNRFDSYGVTINNASIALKVEFPASRVEQRGSDRHYIRIRRTQGLVLGADAQTLSWGQVMSDFPELRPSESPVAKQLRMALGSDPLRAQVFKVPHHASKHGVNLELVELIKPSLSLISCAAGGGRYHFPHTVAQESVREALESIATTGATHRPDHDLGIHYTGSTDTDGRLLGSIAVVISPSGRKRSLWRFGDRPDEPVPIGSGRLFLGHDLSAELPTEDVETVVM
jgi:beta-lactamase superfamily II metal-dependent hydrolase